MQNLTENQLGEQDMLDTVENRLSRAAGLVGRLQFGEDILRGAAAGGKITVEELHQRLEDLQPLAEALTRLVPDKEWEEILSHLARIEGGQEILTRWAQEDEEDDNGDEDDCEED